MKWSDLKIAALHNKDISIIFFLPLLVAGFKTLYPNMICWVFNPSSSTIMYKIDKMMLNIWTNPGLKVSQYNKGSYLKNSKIHYKDIFLIFFLPLLVAGFKTLYPNMICWVFYPSSTTIMYQIDKMMLNIWTNHGLKVSQYNKGRYLKNSL